MAIALHASLAGCKRQRGLKPLRPKRLCARAGQFVFGPIGLRGLERATHGDLRASANLAIACNFAFHQTALERQQRVRQRRLAAFRFIADHTRIARECADLVLALTHISPRAHMHFEIAA